MMDVDLMMDIGYQVQVEAEKSQPHCQTGAKHCLAAFGNRPCCHSHLFTAL